MLSYLHCSNKNTLFWIGFTFKIGIMYHHYLINKDQTPNADLEKVRALIVGIVGKCSLYLFGYREQHFYILVFTDVSITGTHLMNEIQQRSNKTISATVLVHKVKHLSTKQKSQQYFFDQVLRHGQRLYLDTANVPYILNPQPERDLEADTKFWQKCVAVALFNLQAAKEHPQVEVVLCKIALLHGACVPIALGLIRVFLGYSPREFGLKYLMQLCCYFTALPQEVFPQNDENDIRLYKMLCAPADMLLHWTKLDAAETDFEVLLERTELFLDKAKEIETLELNRLKTLT